MYVIIIKIKLVTKKSIKIKMHDFKKYFFSNLNPDINQTTGQLWYIECEQVH